MGHFTLNMAKLCCKRPLHGSPPSLTSHPYISACGIDKKYLKWQEIQLAMLCRVGKIITRP